AGLGLAGFFALAPERLGEGSPWWLYAGAAIGASAVVAVIPLASDRARAAIMAGLAALILYDVAGYLTVPRLQQLWLSERLAQAVERHAQPGDPPVVTAGYAEPSARFVLGTGTRLDLGPEAGATTARNGGLALVEEKERPAFLGA